MTKVTAHSGAAGTVAFQIKDRSTNKVLQPGWFALARRGVASDPMQHPVGALLVIERTRDGLTERSIRRLVRKTNGTVELACHSTVKRYQRDRVRVPTQGEAVKVVGLVVGKSSSLASE